MKGCRPTPSTRYSLAHSPTTQDDRSTLAKPDEDGILPESTPTQERCRHPRRARCPHRLRELVPTKAQEEKTTTRPPECDTFSQSGGPPPDPESSPSDSGQPHDRLLLLSEVSPTRPTTHSPRTHASEVDDARNRLTTLFVPEEGNSEGPQERTPQQHGHGRKEAKARPSGTVGWTTRSRPRRAGD